MDAVVREPRAWNEKFIRVPLSEISNPVAGRICYGPSYWNVTPEGEVLFFRKKFHSPQCNSNKFTADHLRIEGCEIKLIEMVYLPHDCHDYV